MKNTTLLDMAVNKPSHHRLRRADLAQQRVSKHDVNLDSIYRVFTHQEITEHAGMIHDDE